MSANRRSIRLTMIDPWTWEVSVVDTLFLNDGSQQRSLVYARNVAHPQIRRVAHDLVEGHILGEVERQRQESVAAAERE